MFVLYKGVLLQITQTHMVMKLEMFHVWESLFRYILLQQMKILLFSSNHRLSLDVQGKKVFFFYLSKGLRVNTLLYCEKADVGAKLRRCHCIPYQSTNSLFSSKILLKKANVCSGTTVCVSHKDKKNIYNRGL